jgi:hypothetical protein
MKKENVVGKQIYIIGCRGKDPVNYFSQNGMPVARIPLTINRCFTERHGLVPGGGLQAHRRIVSENILFFSFCESMALMG